MPEFMDTRASEDVADFAFSISSRVNETITRNIDGCARVGAMEYALSRADALSYVIDRKLARDLRIAGWTYFVFVVMALHR